MALRRAVLLTIGCCLLVLPWSIYISTRAATPILISTNGGETLSGGLNPMLIERGYEVYIAPDGRKTWYGPGKWLPEHKSGYLSKDELNLPYEQRDKLLRQRTVAWSINNPGSFLYLQTAKLLYIAFPFESWTI